MSTVRVIAGDGPTSIEAAHRGHAQAVDRLRSLEGELEQAFAQIHNARQELIARAGVSAIVELSEPLTCAWERWVATQEAKEMAEREPSPESLDARREADAVALGNAARETQS